MNKIIKKFVIFVLPFLFLFINVSYATFDMNSQPTATSDYSDSSDVVTPFIEEFTTKTGYTPEEVLNTAQYKNSSNETQKQLYITTLNACSSAGYNIITDSNTILYIYPNLEGFDLGVNSYFCLSMPVDYSYMQIATHINRKRLFTCTSAGRNARTFSETFHNSKVKKLSASYTWDESMGYYFTPTLVNPVGTYYASGTEPDEPDTPSLPSNSEIAQAVQSFYNSDYYKNNKDFKDFIVMYNTQNQYFDFIGHTLGNTLGQVIIPPNYRYQGKLYNEQWWKFYIDENQGATAYGTSYYLYSSNDFGENFTNYGIGKISELVGLDFSTKSVIVYSTTDYPVRTYVLNEETGDYTYTDGIIKGDQYTYDENLDPTISGYNPLDNFITVDPSQTIIGDADFEGFANSFEEHKDLFSFTENMQWLVAANNKLSNYFLGFIVMCALFITLSRVLKG